MGLLENLLRGIYAYGKSRLQYIARSYRVTFICSLKHHLCQCRVWETIRNPAKGNCTIHQGSWRHSTSSIWNREDCNFLLWHPSTTRLQRGGMPSLGFGTYSWTCSTNLESYACTRWLSWCKGLCQKKGCLGNFIILINNELCFS